jgi:hypothetical protein
VKLISNVPILLLNLISIFSPRKDLKNISAKCKFPRCLALPELLCDKFVCTVLNDCSCICLWIVIYWYFGHYAMMLVITYLSNLILKFFLMTIVFDNKFRMRMRPIRCFETNFARKWSDNLWLCQFQCSNQCFAESTMVILDRVLIEKGI